MLKELNPIIHSQLRLSIMTLLLSVEEADFSWLKEQTGATAGNISVQLDKLSEAGYIDVRKEFVGSRRSVSIIRCCALFIVCVIRVRCLVLWVWMRVEI